VSTANQGTQLPAWLTDSPHPDIGFGAHFFELSIHQVPNDVSYTKAPGARLGVAVGPEVHSVPLVIRGDLF
jgi:hypothetical protein